MDVIERLMAGRTTFIVTHRLTTLSKVDLLVELSEGRLVPLELAPERAPRVAVAGPATHQAQADRPGRSSDEFS